MLRLLVLLALGLVLALLLRAVVHDFTRRRRAQVLARIRTSFLHGMALAPPSRGAATTEIVWSGLRLAFPSTWRVDVDGERLTCRFPLDESPAVTAEPNSLPTPLDASVEYLAGGAQLARWVHECAGRGQVGFVWCVAIAQRSWAFKAELPVASVDEVTRQADLARLDQTIRTLEVVGSCVEVS